MSTIQVVFVATAWLIVYQKYINIWYFFHDTKSESNEEETKTTYQ